MVDDSDLFNYGEIATAEIDDRGRLVVPKAVRKALGIYGESAIVRFEIEVREKLE